MSDLTDDREEPPMTTSPALVAESREALDNWLLTHRYRDSTAGRAAHCSCGEWDLSTAMTHQEHLIDIAFADGTVTTAEAHREQIAQAWDEGFEHARFRHDMELVGECADNPYRDEETP